MKKLILNAVVATFAVASPGLVPRAVVAAPKTRALTYFVRQDFSNCLNSDVKAEPPAVLGGEAMVTLRDGGKTEVDVRLVKAAPNTTYHVFLKCHYLLGDIKTDETGHGNNTFFFPTSDSGSVFAFDMYPDGAPSGNKFQSTQVSFQ